MSPKVGGVVIPTGSSNSTNLSGKTLGCPFYAIRNVGLRNVLIIVQ